MAANFKIFLLQSLIFAVITVQSIKLPRGIRPCHMDESSEPCRRQALEEALGALAPGNRQLGVPVLEPLLVPSIEILGNGGQINLNQEYNNLNVTGHTKTSVLQAKFKVNSEECQLKMESLTPILNLEGRYRFTGRIFLLPINGHGPANITLTNMKAHHVLSCELKGEYIQITNWKVEFIPERIYFGLPNLFNGNEELSRHLLDVMQSNEKEVFESLRADYQKTFGEIYSSIANQLFSRIKYKQIFLY